MTLHYTEMYHRRIDYLVELAAKNLDNGVIEEPRAYYDVLTLLDVDQITNGAPGVFVNGEQFPVRITQMSAAIRPDFVNGEGLDERFIQRMGLRLTFHDQFYMSRNFVAAPLWLDKCVAAADLVTQGTSTWVFERPVILSARDSLRIEVQLEQVPASPRRVSVSFTGTGMLSKRPYFFGDERDLSGDGPTVLDTTRFRNDGTEPVALTDMAIHCGAEADSAVGQGDIRQLKLQVRQVGNGTQADWFQGPTGIAGLNRMPGVLAGYSTGRAIVHRFPGKGLLWEPGEGITLDALALSASVETLDLALSLSGYIMVV